MATRSEKCPPCCNDCAWGKDAGSHREVQGPVKIVARTAYDTSCGTGQLGRTANGAFVRLERLRSGAMRVLAQVRPLPEVAALAFSPPVQC